MEIKLKDKEKEISGIREKLFKVEIAIKEYYAKIISAQDIIDYNKNLAIKNKTWEETNKKLGS